MEIIDSAGNIVDKKSLSSNSEFIRNQTKIIPEGTYSEMLTFLQFEEYLIRKMMLSFDIGDASLYPKMLEYYYEQVGEYLKMYGINSSRESLETMELTLDNEKYQADFQKEKVLRRK